MEYPGECLPLECKLVPPSVMRTSPTKQKKQNLPTTIEKQMLGKNGKDDKKIKRIVQKTKE